MSVITITNTKGGTGKTSTAFHLASCWAQDGKRVLIIDADPQASITSGFWGQNVLWNVPPENTIHELFAGSTTPSHLIIPSPIDGVDVVAGHEEMETWMLPSRNQDRWWVRLEGSIKRLTDQVKGDYHHVLIDTPPNLSLITHAALTASDFAVIPVQPEDFGVRGLERVERSISRVQGSQQGWPWILGYLLVMYQKSKQVHQAYEKILRNKHKEKVFDVVVPDAHDFVKSLMTFETLAKVNKSGPAFKAMVSLRDEIDAKIMGFDAVMEKAAGRVA